MALDRALVRSLPGPAERIGQPSSADVRSPFTGGAPGPNGLTEVVVCCCSCSGCNPLVVRIEMGTEHVRWSGAHVHCLMGAVDPGFVINREARDEALRDAECRDGTVWEPPPGPTGRMGR